VIANCKRDSSTTDSAGIMEGPPVVQALRNVVYTTVNRDDGWSDWRKIATTRSSIRRP